MARCDASLLKAQVERSNGSEKKLACLVLSVLSSLVFDLFCHVCFAFVRGFLVFAGDVSCAWVDEMMR